MHIHITNGGNIILYKTGFAGPIMAKKVPSSKIYIHGTGFADLFFAVPSHYGTMNCIYDTYLCGIC
jgi:hypothetical protein